MGLARFSLTCLSVLLARGPDVGYYMESNWERSEERKREKEVERGEEEQIFRCELTCTRRTASGLFGFFTQSVVKYI